MGRFIEGDLDKTVCEAKVKEGIGIVIDGILVTKNIVNSAIEVIL